MPEGGNGCVVLSFQKTLNILNTETVIGSGLLFKSTVNRNETLTVVPVVILKIRRLFFFVSFFGTQPCQACLRSSDSFVLWISVRALCVL